MRYCECGCGLEVKGKSRYKRGHNSRKMSAKTKERISVSMRRAYRSEELHQKHSTVMKKLWEEGNYKDRARPAKKQCSLKKFAGNTLNFAARLVTLIQPKRRKNDHSKSD